MMNRVWTVYFLFPFALGACSAPADGDPFEEADSTPDNPAVTARPAPSTPASGDGNAPAGSVSPTPGGGETTALPVLPATAPENGSEPSAPPAEGTEPTPPPGEPTPLPSANDAACASYETGFLPLVHEPVCSGCHTGGGGLPRFEPFAEAERRCAQIGQLVASGEMPPNGSLSAEQRALVASWVSLDCPETAADAAAVCTPANIPDPDVAPPPVPGGGDDDDEDDNGDDDGDDDDGDDDDD